MSRVRVLVIDGQGGGLGRQLTAALAAGCPDIELTAVGTNSIAASAMLKAGAHRAATGENAVVVNCRRADIIVGPIGIVIADALLGEITPAMAAAVCQSSAARVLIPVNHCDNIVAVSYTHLRAHETDSYLVCRLLLEKKKTSKEFFSWKKKTNSSATFRRNFFAWEK